MHDSLVQRLAGQYLSVISSLHSKLGSRTAPPLLHLDPVYLQEESPINLLFSSTSAPDHSSPISSPKPEEHWSLLEALMDKYQKLRTQDENLEEHEPQSEFLFSTDVSSATKWSTISEDFTFEENEGGTDIKSPVLPESEETISVVQPDVGHTEGSDAGHVNTLRLHRKYRSLLQPRLIPGAKGKSKYLFQNNQLGSKAFSKPRLFCISPLVCPGLREASQQVSQIQNSYSWVLNIPSKNLRMNFQEVNDRQQGGGIYVTLF